MSTKHTIIENYEPIIFNKDELNIKTLFEIYLKEPRVTVYVLDSDRIGIITLGNFRRNQLEGKELINYNFKKVNLQNKKEAENILDSSDSIFSIPVFDENGNLLFEYKKQCNETFPEELWNTCISDIQLFSLLYDKIYIISESLYKKKDILDVPLYVENIIFLNGINDLDQLTSCDLSQSLVVDLDYEKFRVRELFYIQMHLLYKVLKFDFDNIDEFKVYLRKRVAFFDNVLCNSALNNILGDGVEDCKILLPEDITFSADEQCFIYKGENVEYIECLFLFFSCEKIGYIKINDTPVPIISVYYLDDNLDKVCANYDVAYNILPRLFSYGVKCIMFDNPDTELGKIQEITREWTGAENIREFLYLDPLVDEKAKEMEKLLPMVNDRGYLSNLNVIGKYVNYIDGERFTPDNPENFQNTIFLFGPCFVQGLLVDDYNTVSYSLRGRIPDDYYIRNCGMRWNSINFSMRSHTYKEGDIVVLFCYDKEPFLQKGEKILSMRSVYEVDDLASHVWDNLLHCDAYITKRIADTLCKEFDRQCYFSNNTIQGLTERYVSFGNRSRFEESEDLEQWLQEVHDNCECSPEGKIGAIVMNCNPFTLGHRYLIEQACSQVDFLYIFVVEEDKSYFSFKDRIEMVKIGTKDLSNVIVVPSGKYIISTKTLPGYFYKEDKQGEEFDASEDLEIFAKIISPRLGISVRFVGTEPLDLYTNRYNMFMKQILPRYGINLVEIARKQSEGKYISASRVREALKNKNFKELESLVMPDIYQFLQERY